MFYVIVDGIVSEIQMSYLTHPSGRRLDKTMAPGKSDKKDRGKNQHSNYVIEAMTKSVLTEDHEISVEDALKIFKEKKIHHLVLTKKLRVIGIVSDRDILWVDKMNLAQHAMAKQFMAKTILCCHEETPIDYVAKVMIKEEISALPVMNDEHTLTGIITHHDLLKQLY
jgi:CBS domain-containing protein